MGQSFSENSRKDFVLACATAMEMRAALALLPGGSECDLSFWEQGALLARPERELPRLCLPGCGVRLLVCGVGPVVSALSLALAAGREPAGTFRGVVNMGFAGSYDCSAVPVGSVVLADEECFPEYGVWPESDEHVAMPPPGRGPAPVRAKSCLHRTGGHGGADAGSARHAPGGDCKDARPLWPPEAQNARAMQAVQAQTDAERPCGLREEGAGLAQPGMPHALRFAQGRGPSGPVFSRLPLEAHNMLGKLGLNCHTSFLGGVSATLAGVSGTRRRALRMRALTGALIENMEGFALALGALSLGLPFAEIRSVSNEAGRRPPYTWNFDKAAHALGLAAQRLFAPFV